MWKLPYDLSDNRYLTKRYQSELSLLIYYKMAVKYCCTQLSFLKFHSENAEIHLLESPEHND